MPHGFCGYELEMLLIGSSLGTILGICIANATRLGMRKYRRLNYETFLYKRLIEFFHEAPSGSTHSEIHSQAIQYAEGMADEMSSRWR